MHEAFGVFNKEHARMLLLRLAYVHSGRTAVCWGRRLAKSRLGSQQQISHPVCDDKLQCRLINLSNAYLSISVEVAHEELMWEYLHFQAEARSVFR